ncbi:TPA: amidophosphoribosyltransferase [Candidatus Gracilibacteria bacterium]|nr:amidophosphoribosyltransferase [Candidatus Gracilibacteria bacterium]
MCGVFGIVAQAGVSQDIFDALTMLQHRGQDAAGIATVNENDRIVLRKDNGLVRDVIHTRHMKHLQGNSGIGHVRYPTAGCASPAEAQPFYVNSPFGLVLAHNGSLTNTDELKKEVFEIDKRHLNTNSDSEVLTNVFAHELLEAQELKGQDLETKNIFKAVKSVFKRCKGGYAVTAMIVGHGMVAFRDPHGIRPLCYGKRISENGKNEYAISSESVALDALGFELIGDVPAGGMLFIPFDGSEMETDFPTVEENRGKFAPCIFEYVYLARPDSIIDGVSVYKARLRQGRTLAKTVLKELSKEEIDVVIPIPDSGRTAAIDLAHELDAKYREGFIKNRYIGRTFIMPGQAMRAKSVRQKLNTTPLEFKGKNVLLVDDSIVRGTTSKKIVEMARQAGAKKVYFASAAPAVRFPNVYGIDLPAREDLVANGLTNEEIAKKIGADKVFYQKLEDLHGSIQDGNRSIEKFEDGCFSGNYITGDIDEGYLKKIECLRGNVIDSVESADNSNELIL